MSIISIDPFMIKGKSGNIYQFVTYPLDAEFPENSGVYIYTRSYEVGHFPKHDLIYCGKADKLSIRINQHSTDPNDKIYPDPDSIHILITKTKQDALSIETDILEANKFIQNKQHQDQ